MCVCYCQQYTKYWKHCHGNATMCSIFCGAPYVTVNILKHTYIFIYTSYFGSILTIWIFLTDFPRSFQYQISWKSIQWELHRYMQPDREMDRHAVTNRCFCCCQCTKKCRHINNFQKNERLIRIGYDYFWFMRNRRRLLIIITLLYLYWLYFSLCFSWYFYFTIWTFSCPVLNYHAESSQHLGQIIHQL